MTRSPRARLLVALATSFFFIAIALPAASMTIHALGDQDPGAAGFRVGGGFDAWTRGWRFRVNDPDIAVTGLGLAAPGSGDFILSLFDASNGSVLAQQNVTHHAGSWQWSTLSSAVHLSNGSEYIVAVHSPGNAQYYFGRESAALPSWFPTGTIEYLETAYCNDCAPDTLPTNTLANYQYGVVDVEYTVVPEPNSALLMGLGLCGLVWSGGKQTPIGRKAR